MVSLVDIGKLRKNVPIRGMDIEVRGLPAKYIVDLLAGSTELRMLMAEQRLDGDLVVSLASQLPVMVAQCIAYATGKPEDDETIRFILDELGPEEVVDLLSALVELTFPRGPRSFVEGLLQAARRSGLAVPGWDQVMKSQEASSSASPTGTPPKSPGTTLPASSPDGSNSSEEKASSTSAS